MKGTQLFARACHSASLIEAERYGATIAHLKPSQPYRRLRARLGMPNRLGIRVCEYSPNAFSVPPLLHTLENDAHYFSHFDVDALLAGDVLLIGSRHHIEWGSEWKAEQASDLWNFNLHYCEFLPALAWAWRQTESRAYLECAESIITEWIAHHPRREGGIAWSPYVVSLRAPAWLSFLAIAEDSITSRVKQAMEQSLHEHMVYLEAHLELDILGNHLLENLKALVLLAVAFDDEPVLDAALELLEREIKAQILSDGMHAERSPMYHNIALEGLLRVACAIGRARTAEYGFIDTLQTMLDASAMLSSRTRRLPHFNDCATGIAREYTVLAAAASECCGLTARPPMKLESAGYTAFSKGEWLLIIDHGPLGLDYQPGHAHCDMLSFELFWRGIPVITNCGTYAYQHELRPWFRSTSAHNTLHVCGVEQSDCWATFRVGKRATIGSVESGDSSLTAAFTDMQGNRLARSIEFTDGMLIVKDHSFNGAFASYLHIPSELDSCGLGTCITATQACAPVVPTKSTVPYSEEFGVMKQARQLAFTAESSLDITIDIAQAEKQLSAFYAL